jgi:hypothetical protein
MKNFKFDIPKTGSPLGHLASADGRRTRRFKKAIKAKEIFPVFCAL